MIKSSVTWHAQTLLDQAHSAVYAVTRFVYCSFCAKTVEFIKRTYWYSFWTHFDIDDNSINIIVIFLCHVVNVYFADPYVSQLPVRCVGAQHACQARCGYWRSMQGTVQYSDRPVDQYCDIHYGCTISTARVHAIAGPPWSITTSIIKLPCLSVWTVSL